MVGAGSGLDNCGCGVVGDSGGVGVGSSGDGIDGAGCGGEGAAVADAGCDSEEGGAVLAGVGAAPPVRLWTTFIIAAILFGFSLDFICGLLRSGRRERSVSALPSPPPCEVPLAKSPSSFCRGLAGCADELVLVGG